MYQASSSISSLHRIRGIFVEFTFCCDFQLVHHFLINIVIYFLSFLCCHLFPFPVQPKEELCLLLTITYHYIGSIYCFACHLFFSTMPLCGVQVLHSFAAKTFLFSHLLFCSLISFLHYLSPSLRSAPSLLFCASC